MKRFIPIQFQPHDSEQQRLEKLKRLADSVAEFFASSGGVGPPGPPGPPGSTGPAGVVQSIVQGTNIVVDASDPANPVISASGGSGSGVVVSVAPGTGIDVDASDPANPVVSVESGIVSGAAAGATAVQPARSLTAGDGLTGGGDLSSDRTFAVGAGTGISVNANDVAISDTAVTPGSYTNASITVDQQGRITAASSGTGAPTVVSQASTLTITSNNTFQTTSLTTSLVAGVYLVQANLWCDVHATPDMEIQFQYTGTVVNLNGRRTAFRMTVPATSEDQTVSLADTLYNMNDTSRFYVEYSFLVEVSSSGTFAIYARQVTSSGTSVSFLAGSTMTLTKTV